ncbi:MAG: hypothetical protein HYV63_08095 [Candidatus Schekmanbacteria bacterium]|nr:hypothetical protein [Candidatus Schekmanbacteria bacterium]
MRLLNPCLPVALLLAVAFRCLAAEAGVGAPITDQMAANKTACSIGPRIALEVEPENVEVLLDGELLGTVESFDDLTLPTGLHEIELRHQGHIVHQEAVRVLSKAAFGEREGGQGNPGPCVDDFEDEWEIEKDLRTRQQPAATAGRLTISVHCGFEERFARHRDVTYEGHAAEKWRHIAGLGLRIPFTRHLSMAINLQQTEDHVRESGVDHANRIRATSLSFGPTAMIHARRFTFFAGGGPVLWHVAVREPSGQSSVKVGVQAGLGIDLHLSPWLAPYVETRYTALASQEFGTDGGQLFAGARVPLGRP